MAQSGNESRLATATASGIPPVGQAPAIRDFANLGTAPARAARLGHRWQALPRCIEGEHDPTIPANAGGVELRFHAASLKVLRHTDVANI